MNTGSGRVPHSRTSIFRTPSRYPSSIASRRDQKLHMFQQAALGQHLEQAPQQLLRLLRLGAALHGHLPHRGLAAVAQPLQDAAGIVAGAAFQLDVPSAINERWRSRRAWSFIHPAWKAASLISAS